MTCRRRPGGPCASQLLPSRSHFGVGQKKRDDRDTAFFLKWQAPLRSRLVEEGLRGRSLKREQHINREGTLSQNQTPLSLVPSPAFGLAFPVSVSQVTKSLAVTSVISESCLQRFTLGQFCRTRVSYMRIPSGCVWRVCPWLIVLLCPSCSNLSWNTTDDSLRAVSLILSTSRSLPRSRVSSTNRV